MTTGYDKRDPTVKCVENGEIEDISTIGECTRRMREISEINIGADDIRARHLSDLMHRFADAIDRIYAVECEKTEETIRFCDRVSDAMFGDCG